MTWGAFGATLGTFFGEAEILTRSSLLGVALVILTGLAGFRTYELWRVGPWELPSPGKERAVAAVEGKSAPPQRPVLASTKNIIEKNLFDPERGQGKSREGEVQSAAAQRVRAMVLLGTAILGNSRYAIVQGPSETRFPPGKPQPVQSNQIRLKLGDSVEGFKVAEIQEKKVVFERGATKVEISLDFMRKVDDANVRSGAPGIPVGPRAPTPVPRRVPGEARE